MRTREEIEQSRDEIWKLVLSELPTERVQHLQFEMLTELLLDVRQQQEEILIRTSGD
jgi:hypothetical protein